MAEMYPTTAIPQEGLCELTCIPGAWEGVAADFQQMLLLLVWMAIQSSCGEETAWKCIRVVFEQPPPQVACAGNRRAPGK